MIRIRRGYSLTLLLLITFLCVSLSAHAQKPQPASAGGAESAERQKPLMRPASLDLLLCARFSIACPKGPTCTVIFRARFTPSRGFASREKTISALTRRRWPSINPKETRAKRDEVPASGAPLDQHLYDRLIDAFSMRTFVPTTADSGHDQFFDTFDRFGGTSKTHMGEWLDEVATRAAAQNEQYLELMDTPDFKQAAALTEKIGFNTDFAQYRQQLLDAGIRDSIPAIRTHFDQAEADRNQREHCGEANAEPACNVEIRFIYQILRGQPPPVVFAQLLLGFEAAAADPHIVGLNLVQPEDGYIAMRDYRLQMQMLDTAARLLSTRSHHTACRRARARHGSARRPDLSYPPGR